MAKKRGSGEGTVFQRADGRWVGTISLGFSQRTGKRQRKTIYGTSQGEVLQKLEDLKQQRKHGAKTILAKDTVAGYLQRWLDDDVILNKAAKTHQEYEQTVRLYISPFIGQIRLTKLDGEQLVAWQGKLARQKFTANMRLRAIRVLRNALNKAVKLRILQFNPMAAVDKPKVLRKEVTPLEPDQCHRLVQACQEHRLGDLIILAAMTGLRKGELFALDWNAVNLQEGVLVVRRTLQELSGLTLKEPKTAAGKRVVSLGREAVEALRNRQRKALEEGFDPSEVPIVFPNTSAGYLRSSNFDRNVWYPIRKAAGIPDTFVFHDLRHTQASLMLAAGVDLKVIQKRLGHRDFATTANTYSHLLQGAQTEAVQKVDALLSRTGVIVAEKQCASEQ
ncbi:MAG: tyrosine-type recombinase/integrase [Planctomyces sp.]